MAKDAFALFTESFQKWNRDDAPKMAAAIAFYALFSIAPLLVIVIAIAGLVYGEVAARGQVVGAIGGVIGPDAAKAVEAIVANAGRPGSGGITATLVSLGMLLFGVSGAFVALQDALNKVWQVKPKPGIGLVRTVKNRALSFLLALGVGLLLLMALFASGVLAAIAGYFSDLMPGIPLVWQVADFLLSLGMVTLLFAMVYQILPDVDIPWSDVWLGAGVTALLFTIGNLGIGLYLGRASVGSVYGAAGSLVVLLFWVYYSAQVVLYGAEFTQVYGAKYGSRARQGTGVPSTLEETEPREGEPVAEGTVDASVERRPTRSVSVRSVAAFVFLVIAIIENAIRKVRAVIG